MNLRDRIGDALAWLFDVKAARPRDDRLLAAIEKIAACVAVDEDTGEAYLRVDSVDGRHLDVWLTNAFVETKEHRE